VYAQTLAASKAGFQTCIHAIGDRANRLVMDTFERVQKEVPGARELRMRNEQRLERLLAELVSLDLEPVLLDDSLLQRIIASVVVRRPPGQVNELDARALQSYLVNPATQADIRSFRLPGIDEPIFWPAGNQNDN
jgi:hypothetical protein